MMPPEFRGSAHKLPLLVRVSSSLPLCLAPHLSKSSLSFFLDVTYSYNLSLSGLRSFTYFIDVAVVLVPPLVLFAFMSCFLSLSPLSLSLALSSSRSLPVFLALSLLSSFLSVCLSKSVTLQTGDRAEGLGGRVEDTCHVVQVLQNPL